MFETVVEHRELVIELIKREFAGRYRGSYGGVLWSLIEPLLMLAIYVTAFGLIMQVRWNQSGDAREYALMMFAGLIVYLAFAECLNKSPTVIVANSNFVRKVVFPLELLPLVMSIVVLFHLLIAIMLWLVGYLFFYGVPHFTIIYFPLVLIAFFPMMLAVGWGLSSLGVVIRDINHVTSMISRALLFMTPIFYSLELAPELIKNAMLLNPLTYIIDQLRLILFLGKSPDLLGLLIYFSLALLLSFIALRIFQRIRPTFADNL